MVRRFTTASRIAAFTAVVTLITSSLASAQTPAAPRTDALSKPSLMTAAAFARLVQPRRPDVARPVTAEAPRLKLRQPATTTTAAHAATVPMKAPRQQQNWFMRHPGQAWFIIGASIFGGILLAGWASGAFSE